MGLAMVAAGSEAIADTDKALAPVTNKQMIINGGFNQDKTAWYVLGSGSAVYATAGQDGGPALALDNIVGDPADNLAWAIQGLHLPSQTTAATYAFDYRLVQTYGPAGAFAAQIWSGNDLQTSSLVVTLVASGWVNSTTTWQHVSGSLDSATVASIQAAHAAGQHVWFVAALYQTAANQFQAHLDNVSLLVTGSMNYPNTAGEIEYIGLDPGGYDKTVNRIRPDGTSLQTLWTHPAVISSTNHLYDVAWKPDGSELAVSSNHESAYSAFNCDVHGIKPDGTGLRRITNPPSKAEIDAGGYAMGTVTGTIRNNYGSVSPFLVYVEGAKEPEPENIGGFGSEVPFTVSNVADLGTNLHYVVFIWSKTGSCANGREYAAAVVDVTAGGTEDTGRLDFGGICGTCDSNSITWTGDGAQLGVDVITPRKFIATGQAIGADLFSAPLTADQPAWSQANDRLLYSSYAGFGSGTNGIYLTTVGGGTGTRQVNTGNSLWFTAAWLPDGSGFVHTVDQQLRQFILAGGQDTLLAQFYNEYVDHPGVSPDGQYVVFDRRSTGTPLQCDLWILNRTRPAEMWAVTTGGKSDNPDWSRTGPVVTQPSFFFISRKPGGGATIYLE